ncbi:MAG: 3-oxoacyl-ACP reductase FabG [Victivallales bacterium]|nr:3-oxoacyl-ACP reductase FabG [Victivallales bacterium]
MSTALIIGGCKGIGRAIVARLASDGFDIIATSRKAGPDSETTEQLVRAQNRAFTHLALDVTDADGSKATLLPYLEGDLLPDVIVYNAGIAKDNLFAFMDAEEWRKVLDTNLNGFYNTVQPFVFGMLARKKGRIIVISSASGQTGQAGQVNYSASKAALLGAVKALAREIGKKGILVNAVAPGVIDTEMTKALPKEQLLPIIPLRRYGTCEEVASVVSFLAGPDSTYVTGQVIAVNGGLVI